MRCQAPLLVFAGDFTIRFGVAANGADFGRSFAFDHVAARKAYPFDRIRALEYGAVSNSAAHIEIDFLVSFFDFGNLAEQPRDFGKTLFFRRFGKIGGAYYDALLMNLYL